MRNIILALVSLLTFTAYADDTKDYVTLSAANLEPGGDAAMVIASLERVENNKYTGFQIDIELPEFLDPVLSKYNEGRTEKEAYCLKLTGDSPEVGLCENSHTVSSNLLYIDGKKTLRIACVATDGTEIYGESGPLLKFLLKANAYSKPGTSDVKIVNTRFGNGNSQYIFDDRNESSVKVLSTSSLSLNVSGTNNWSTCILPFTAAVPEGVKAYTVSSYDEKNLKLTESKTIEAYTPYILYSESGYSGTLSGTVDASGYPEKGYTEGSVLKGAIVAQTVKNGYVMQKQDGEVMFYKIKEGDSFSVPAGKCWLELPESSAKSLSFTFEDETGIDTVRPAVKTSDIYLIDGRRVSELQPGKLYIKGGAKYVKQ